MSKAWTGVEHQSPSPKLEIFTKGAASEKADMIYSADPKAGPYSKLLGYTFSESVDDLEGAFSFTIENEDIGSSGETSFDKIPIRSVVKIYEGDKEKPVFVGIVRRRHLGVSMSSQGVRRTVTFSGKSIISCITEYTISLDVRIQNVSNALSRNNQLLFDLSKYKDGIKIKNFMTETWNHFKTVAKTAQVATTGLGDIIDAFICGGIANDFINVPGEEKLRYNIACTFYNAANNVIADVWRNILPKPVYELFAYCKDGEPKIMARQTPYGDPKNGNYDWKNLEIYPIRPLSLMSYELDQSDEEVYTSFSAYIIGSAMRREFYLAVNNAESTDSTVQHDKEKEAIYGFKPLEISFNGYNREGNEKGTDTETLTNAIKALNERTHYWFSRMEEMYSGSVTVCTDFNNPETNPRAGCRAKFLGAEFYINKADHIWNYGGTPTIKLTLSRGMMYDENGKIIDGDAGKLKNAGKQYRELKDA